MRRFGFGVEENRELQHKVESMIRCSSQTRRLSETSKADDVLNSLLELKIVT